MEMTKRQEISTSSSIPEELHLEILSRLPVKSILRCKSVCKSWFSLISNPSFVKKHLDFTLQNNTSSTSLLVDEDRDIYSISDDSLQLSVLIEHEEEEDYEDDVDSEIVDYPFKSLGFSIGLVGSFNGLVCLMFYRSLGDYDEYEIKFYCIWNPATREFKKIALPLEPDNHPGRICLYAFGYDHQNGDYKLLSLSKDQTHSSVYSLGLDRWKSISHAATDWVPLTDSVWNWNGVLVNGNHHWLAVSSKCTIIVSLNISTEKFEEMEVPIDYRKRIDWYENITHGALEGCLCLLAVISEIGVEVWVMEDYGVGESWTRRYTITNEVITKAIVPCRFKIMGNFKNGQILFMDTGKLILYDSNNGGVSERIFSVTDVVVMSAEKCLESLVSFNSGTCMGRGQLEASTAA